MNKAHPLSLPMIVRSLDVKNDPFRSCENGEELLGPEVPYLVSLVHLCILLTVLSQILFFCQFISHV